MRFPNTRTTSYGFATMPSADFLGHETLAVLAGAFACEHYRSKKGFETWLNKKVVLWGIVKEQGASNEKPWSMLLLRRFSDAKDRIAGTPQPILKNRP
jgi:hypothetical protein